VKEFKSRENRSRYAKKEWIGQKFGTLTVTGYVNKEHNNGNHEWWWTVRCECGNEKEMQPLSLISGKNSSCGCRKYKTISEKVSTHKESHTRLHDIWTNMNKRCNPSNKCADRYGARGIFVCDEWGDYEAFAEWARSNNYAEDLSIERKDVNKGYSPDNCEWIPLGKQARNRRTTFWVTYNGREMSLAEACELAKLPYKEVHYRIKRLGWTIEHALSEPIFHGTQAKRLREKCAKSGVKYRTAINRIYSLGWDEDRAANTPTLGRGANKKSY
jgi:hypothetical protein